MGVPSARHGRCQCEAMATLFEEKKKNLTALDLATRTLGEERAASKPEEEEVDEGIKNWTSAGTISRLITKEATDYYNLDPYRVLGLKWNATFEEAKKTIQEGVAAGAPRPQPILRRGQPSFRRCQAGIWQARDRRKVEYCVPDCQGGHVPS